MARGRVIIASRGNGPSHNSQIGEARHIHPVNLGGTDATANLANATCDLWKAGSAAQYWYFHHSSAYRYQNVNIPSYQFEKVSHWIEYKPRLSKTEVILSGSKSAIQEAPSLVSKIEGNKDTTDHIFKVNTAAAVFELAAQGHAVTGKALCPASMYVELVASCAILVQGGANPSDVVPRVQGLTMSAPLGLRSGVLVFVHLRPVANSAWEFTVLSGPSLGAIGVQQETEHGKGLATLVHRNDVAVASQFKLLQHFTRGSRAERIRKLPSATGVSGSMVYNVFSDVVSYATYYHGVRNISAADNEAMGLVAVPRHRPQGMEAGISDPIILDNFLQVAGIHVNCLSPRKVGEVFMCTAIGEMLLSPTFVANRSDSRSWIVYTSYEATSSVSITNDILVCDAETGELVVAAMGATFRSVPFKSLARSLARLNGNSTATTAAINKIDQESDSGIESMDGAEDVNDCALSATQVDQKPTMVPWPKQTAIPKERSKKTGESSNILQRVQALFSAILEVPVSEIEAESDLDDLGIDSLLVTEVLTEIQTRFGVKLSQEAFQECTNVRSVAETIQPSGETEAISKPVERAGEDTLVNALIPTPPASPTEITAEDMDFGENESKNFAIASRDCFAGTKYLYDQYAEETGFEKFCTDVFPLQSELVTQYVLTAFGSLGCNLWELQAGEEVPMIQFLPKHSKLIPQLYKILENAGLIKKGGATFFRTKTAASKTPAHVFHAEMLKYAKHASETKLLYSTGHKLAECLSGEADPIGLIFGSADARALLADVYTNAPMFKTGTLLLAQYLSSVLERFGGIRPLKILELGAGTGGTTNLLVEKLAELGPQYKFNYTFTDLSSSLVKAAKQKFSKWSFMEYTVLDIEKEVNPKFLNTYDIIISTNCIHATRSLVNSTTNIRKMLRPDGILCLVELTRNLFWFDLVFGLLEGWWLFEDGRKHALASESLWDKDLRAAGFNWVDWSNTATAESDILRVITASPFAMSKEDDDTKVETRADSPVAPTELPLTETVTFKTIEGLDLQADIYYPTEIVESGKTLPVGKHYT